MIHNILLISIVTILISSNISHGQSTAQRGPKLQQPSQPAFRCLSPDPSKGHLLFGTKTTYNEAHKLIKKSSPSISDVVPSECEPIMFYMFKRHGIRYPDGEDIPENEHTLEELKQNLLKFHATSRTASGQPGTPVLCDEDVEMIRKWQINMKQSDDNLISDTGATEISSIAKRFQERYPSLLDPDRGVSMDIAISDRIRTNQTGYHFVKQLYQDKNSAFSYNPSVRLEVSDFHSICVNNLKTQGVYLKNPPVYDEFLRSATMKKVREAVSKRLGLDEPLSVGKFKMLYKGCSFGYAVNQDISWCSIFSNQELRIIEFAEDLDDYFGDAHGRDVNSKAPCVSLEDLSSKIDEIVHLNKEDQSSSPVKSTRAYLRFSHAGSFKQILSYLGMFTSLHVSDFNVTADYSCDSESHDVSSSNEWRSSLVSPFSTNIAFVLHKCPNLTAVDSSSPKFDYRMLSLIQETPTKMRGCNSTLCPLDQFASLLRKSYSCNLKQICRL